ncbi:MAG: ribbon-helix-helix domain-containing protein [Desulfurococcales archaeon]|nr:ribbon-helix-helix domain-containing protein [Desulfurococcales archaeon]
MAKTKTSIYIDKELWEKFKRLAAMRGVEVSRLLEEMISEQLLDEYLSQALLELAGSNDYEIDFEPVKPRSGYNVSELVRRMRDERADRISR